MTFGITQYTNLSRSQVAWINDLSEELKLFFEKRNYGEDLNELYFGLIAVKPEFDQFFKKKRPRYKKGKSTSTVDGITIKSNNCAEIYVKINYSEISELEQVDLIEQVCQAFLIESNCLTRLSDLKKFNYKQFKLDFEEYLIAKSFIKK